jgi:hypothetical protein
MSFASASMRNLPNKKNLIVLICLLPKHDQSLWEAIW